MALWFKSIVLLLSAVTFYGYVKSVKVRIYTQHNQEGCRPANQFKITCKIEEPTLDLTVDWYKNQSEKWVMIGSHNTVNEQFRRTGRYDLSLVDWGDEDVLAILTITNLTAADSGVYNCSSHGVSKSTTVQVPAAKVELKSPNIVNNILQFPKENPSVRIECVVNASSSDVAISILKGSTNIDITKHFSRKQEELKEGLQGLRQISYGVTLDGTLQSSEFTNPEDRLECKASLKGCHWENRVNVLFTPAATATAFTHLIEQNDPQARARLGNGQPGKQSIVSSFLIVFCFGTTILCQIKMLDGRCI